MRRKQKKKSGYQEATTTALLLTAILNLIKAAIELINRLIE